MKGKKKVSFFSSLLVVLGKKMKKKNSLSLSLLSYLSTAC